MNTRIEQVPNPGSRVTIGPEKDELGVPRANLHWELDDLEWKSIRKLNVLIGQQMGKTGIGRVRLLEYLRDPENIYWPDGTNGGIASYGNNQDERRSQEGSRRFKLPGAWNQ